MGLTFCLTHSRMMVVFLALVISQSLSFAQGVEIRGSLGAAYYQGDLAPLSTATSFSEGNISWSMGAGIKLNDWFKLHGRFTLGKLSGDDDKARTRDRRKRNLSFQSPLREVVLLTDFNINKIFPGLDKYGLNLYYTTGVGMFQFDPKVVYKGEVVRLQPLGTEGQFLGYGEPYKLREWCIPFGLGLGFKVNKRISFYLEVVPRKTFTDYIDDVSTNYVSIEEFSNSEMPLAAVLSNRTGESFTGQFINYKTGAQRGDSSDNDWYMLANISIGYTIGKNKKTDPPTDVDPNLPPQTKTQNKE